MPRTMLPLPPPETSPPSSPPERRTMSGCEIVVPCSIYTCSLSVSVLLGTDTLEEAAVDALCVGCVLKLMAGRWGPAA